MKKEKDSQLYLKSSYIMIRISKEDKEKFKEHCRYLGKDMSDVLFGFIKRSIIKIN